MAKTSSSNQHQEMAYQLSNNLARLLREFAKDFETRILAAVHQRGHTTIRLSHGAVFGNLGLGPVRVTELAKRAQVTQQAMGKMLKELERLGYIARDIDDTDRRAKVIRLTDQGVRVIADSMEAVDEIRQHYAQKIGVSELDHLESVLRVAVRKLELDYLPESWVAPDRE